MNVVFYFFLLAYPTQIIEKGKNTSPYIHEVQNMKCTE